MLVVVVLVLVVTSAACGEPEPWWNNAVYYRIAVDSFKDMDGDGLGDLSGAIKQLSYVKALGADAVILSSLSEKSKDCAKPGVLNFIEIDQRYGNNNVFDSLIQKARKLDLKVVVTMDPHKMSTDSEWFKFSVEGKIGFADRMIWKSGDVDSLPADDMENNWTWNEDRKAYWASSENETLLNLCSENVVTALSDAQCTWLKRAAAGVLLAPDFPSDVDCGVRLVRRLAADAKTCARTANLDMPVILVESILSPGTAAEYYGEGGIGVNGVVSYVLAAPVKLPTPDLALALHAALLYTPQDMRPAWLTSRNDGSRITTRYGTEMVDSINLLAMILPGSVIIQQGDELGAADTILEWATNDHCWPNKLMPSAAPFPWDDTPKAGFTNGEPWLPLAPNYRYANAKTEYANDLSHIGVMRIAAAMRKTPAIGPHVEIKRLNDALAVLRWGGSGSLLLVTNFGRSTADINISQIPGLPSEMTVAASSASSSLSPSSHVITEKGIKLGSGEAVLLAGPPRHCSGPGPVDKIANKLNEGWQKLNKYFSNL